jgi:hypothetical protein
MVVMLLEFGTAIWVQWFVSNSMLTSMVD